MRKKLLMGFMALAMAVGTVTAGWAEDVFVTKNGKYYHHADSPFIRNRETTRMTKEEAEAKGYKPSRSYLKAAAKEVVPNAGETQEQTEQ